MGHTMPGYVYLIQPEGFNVYKVGTSIDPPRRLETLQRKRAARLTIRAAIHYANGFGAEQWWHRKFAPHKLSGEWFALPESVVAEFCAIAEQQRAEVRAVE